VVIGRDEGISFAGQRWATLGNAGRRQGSRESRADGGFDTVLDGSDKPMDVADSSTRQDIKTSSFTELRRNTALPFPHPQAR
jgi:hypothetical protein